MSTKIPFKGTSKEYIGDDNTEIAEAVDRAIRACATQLKGKIVRAQAAKERRARKKVLSRYIPDVARAISVMLSTSADAAEPPSKRARSFADEGAGSNGGKLWSVDTRWEKEILERVRGGRVTESTLRRRLEETRRAHRLGTGARVLHAEQGGAERGDAPHAHGSGAQVRADRVPSRVRIQAALIGHLRRIRRPE